MNYFVPLEPEKFYHLFNRAIGTERMFRCEDNYLYFLNKYKEYINPIAETFCYVLMPNHFHFLIRIKSRKELYEHYKFLQINHGKSVVEEGEFDFEKFVMQQYSNFFNCYSKSYNKKYNRKGALFIDYVRRSPIEDLEYLTNMVLYIHQNPIHHHYKDRLDEWRFSSYNAILSQQFTFLKREEVLDWFTGKEIFIYRHTVLKNLTY